jgi:hypothetical protein
MIESKSVYLAGFQSFNNIVVFDSGVIVFIVTLTQRGEQIQSRIISACVVAPAGLYSGLLFVQFPS